MIPIVALDDMFLHEHWHFIFSQSHVHRPKYSLEHQMCIYPRLKIVPNKCITYSCLSDYSPLLFFVFVIPF